MLKFGTMNKKEEKSMDEILELQWKDFIRSEIKVGTYEIKIGEKPNDRKE